MGGEILPFKFGDGSFYESIEVLFMFEGAFKTVLGVGMGSLENSLILEYFGS